MKIDVLVAGNTYGTGVHFAKGLAAGLRTKGVDVRLLWVDEGHFHHAMQEILNDPPDLTCSFADITLQGKPLGDFWQIPHLSFLVDPPIYFLHQMQGKYSSVACVDEEDTAFVKNLDFQRALFLPHAADVAHLTPVDVSRPYNAVFFGTCVDYEAIEQSWPTHERELLLAAAERVLSPEGITITQALHALGVSSYDLPRYHGEVDRYIRGKDRVELIRSMWTPVHIYGEGPWKKYFPHHPVHNAIPFEETLQIMKQSQIVLNSAPRFKAGAHERIFYAYMCGAAVYTGFNRYIETHLPETFTYPFGRWEPLSFDDWRTCAHAGQQRTLYSHTWEARAATLLKCKIAS